jgi:large subunit ribosomal protein L21
MELELRAVDGARGPRLSFYAWQFTATQNALVDAMYAIFRTAGKQFRAEPGLTLRIPTVNAEPGTTLTFEDVLLGSDGSSVKAGTPLLSGASVTAEIVKHGRGEKIIIFKMKRRKNYVRKNGHRQGFTEVRINDIKIG